MTSILAQKSVLASLNISRWNAHKFDAKATKTVQDTHHTAADAGRYNKRLVAKNAMSEINAVAQTARTFHYFMTQPWLDDGKRVLPSALYMEYAQTMRVLRAQFTKAVNDFVVNYPEVVEEAKIRMNGLFNANDYPSVGRIEAEFGFDVSILPVPDTEDFRISITGDAAEDIRKDVEARMGLVVQNSLKDIAQRITESVGHMADRLSIYKPNDENGRSENTFRDSLVENVRELAKVLPSFNMSGNIDLDVVIKKIEEKLCAHDADALREDETLRKDTAKAARDIVSSVSEYF